jgi:hypothetical protein
MSEQFTPGPWKIGDANMAGAVPIFADGNLVVCELDGFGTDISPDANLIAAAPDMFDALTDARERLQQVAEFLDRDGWSLLGQELHELICVTKDRADAALAKARAINTAKGSDR